MNNIEPWTEPKPGKWTVGETLCHLVLMVQLVRRFSIFYVPLMPPLLICVKTEIHDIFQEYHQKQKKPMKAPFVLNPQGIWNRDGPLAKNGS